ncbi:hypothetical protein [Halobaculum sp. D14]|uniref:hypothetical protein n=1 Tax=Halobaculum sp. D14 TaxID=3421642 RepID=UPI003EB73722
MGIFELISQYRPRLPRLRSKTKPVIWAIDENPGEVESSHCELQILVDSKETVEPVLLRNDRERRIDEGVVLERVSVDSFMKVGGRVVDIEKYRLLTGDKAAGRNHGNSCIERFPEKFSGKTIPRHQRGAEELDKIIQRLYGE